MNGGIDGEKESRPRYPLLSSALDLAEQSASFDTKKRLAASQIGVFSTIIQIVTTVVSVYLIHMEERSHNLCGGQRQKVALAREV